MSESENWTVSNKRVLTICGPGLPLGEIINGVQEDAFVCICPNLFRVADGWDLVGAEFLGTSKPTGTGFLPKGLILPSGARGITISPLHANGDSLPPGRYYSAWTLIEQNIYHFISILLILNFSFSLYFMTVSFLPCICA